MRGGAGHRGRGSGSQRLSLLLCRPLFEGENEFCLYLEELFPNLKVECRCSGLLLHCSLEGRGGDGEVVPSAADQEAPMH